MPKFIEPVRISEKITDFKIMAKSMAVEGLEIADLIASPIGRSVMKKKSKEDFRTIRKKFRKNISEHIIGHGMIIFPK